jgi:hypothetical protein
MSDKKLQEKIQDGVRIWLTPFLISLLTFMGKLGYDNLVEKLTNFDNDIRFLLQENALIKQDIYYLKEDVIELKKEVKDHDRDKGE